MTASKSSAKDGALSEKEKWGTYYSELLLQSEDEYTARFNKEFADCICDLMPDGGRTLEAGCGAGWQSMALRRTGRFETALLDFSPEALAYARSVFDRENLQAEFIEEDLSRLGTPEFDLVFNAGVLEHYSFEEQVKLVRGMASRSRCYLLVLVPNRCCYWYWIWRNLRSKSGTWLWGKEIPVASIATVFDAAGIQLLGERYFAAELTEHFISHCTEGAPILRQQALTIHRSHILPEAEKAYLVGALGSTRGEPSRPPSWRCKDSSENGTVSLLTAALSDALALTDIRSAEGMRQQSELKATTAERERLTQEKHVLLGTLDAVVSQTADLQVERRRLAERINELEQRALQLGAEVALHNATADVSKRLLDQIDKRTSEERENLRSVTDRTETYNCQLVAQIDSFRETSLQYARELKAWQDRLTTVERERDALRAELIQITARRDALEQQFTGMVSQHAETARLLNELETRAADEHTHLNGVIAQMQAQHGEMATHLEEFRAKSTKYETDLATSSAATQLLQDQLRTAENECGSLRAHIRELAKNKRELEQHLSQSACRLSELMRAIALKDAAAQQATSNAHRFRQEAQEIRHATVTSATRFDLALTDQLKTVRSQRAWRLMVLIRKAYTLWMRGGLRGKLSALCVPLELLPGRETLLDAYDIPFPHIWDFISRSISQGDPVQAAKPPRTGQYDVIILPIFDFNFRFQRPQQIAAGFARTGHRVFWVSPSRFNENETGLSTESIPLRDNVYEVRLPGRRLNIYADQLSSERAGQLTQALVELYRRHHIGEAVILIQFPFWRQVGLALRDRFGGVLAYDCMDDWRNWTADPRISAFALGEEKRLATEADVLMATSAELHQRFEREARRTVLRLRNAADFEFFGNVAAKDLFEGMQRPIIGYYGALADWVNINLLSELARQRPDYSFVVIGEVHDTDVDPLRRLHNVHLLGEKPYRTLPDYLSGFDVCILPFVLNSLTQAVDPVKVYEYLSQGKPVVATPLPEVRDHGDVVYLAETPEQFAQEVDRAYREDSTERQTARRAYAATNSWDQRVRRLDQAVRDTVPLVSVLVVSYRSREYLKPFLDSIRRNTSYPNYEVIVVDNASDDGSVDLLEAYRNEFPKLRVIRLDTNHGFAAGNNVAARNARGEFLVFVNADTIVTWAWLDRLIRPFKSSGEIGITAAVTNFSGNETRIECEYRTVKEMEEFAKQRSEDEFGNVLELPMVPLLCAAMPRRIWNQVGELDEDFGLGMFEDDDLSIRVKQAGYRLVAVEDCFIHHFGNGSFSKLPHAEALRVFEQNRSYFERKWSTTWVDHTMRPGVRRVTDADRLSPDRFLQRDEDTIIEKCGVKLLRLHPASVELRGSVNRQGDGSSALVAECEGATPGTAIRFGETILQTSYGNAALLSAILPSEFSQRARSIPVTLVNDFGESNALNFTVGS